MSDRIATSTHAQYVDASVFALWELEQAWVYREGGRGGLRPEGRGLCGAMRQWAAALDQDREVDLVFLIWSVF